LFLFVSNYLIEISSWFAVSSEGEENGHGDESKKQMVENILHYTGLSVLSIFMVEVYEYSYYL